MNAVDLLALTFAPNSDRAAETRWRATNARAREAGCRCGRPATVVRRHEVQGSVPAETWSCGEHFDVETWHGTARPDGTVEWVPVVRRGAP